MTTRRMSACTRSLLLCIALWGCESDDAIAPQPPGPIAIRGPQSLIVAFDGMNATMELVDSVAWFPEMALYGIIVSNFQSGLVILNLREKSGEQVWLDTIRGNHEELNRRIVAAMPLRLGISVRGFSGTMTVSLTLAPGDINGTLSRFSLTDSAGRARTSFRVGEPITISYSFGNYTGRPLKWSTRHGRYFCQFKVLNGTNVVRDSYEGRAWTGELDEGIIANADSISIRWRDVVTTKALLPASYTAMADPQFSVDSLGWPWMQQIAFSVIGE